MSDSHKQLLKTMLFYEQQNYVMIELVNPKISKKRREELELVRAYLDKRLGDLK